MRQYVKMAKEYTNCGNGAGKIEGTMQFAICLDNTGYEASLETGKLYQVVHDDEATKHGYIRLIDESGDDYAFVADRFHLLQLPPPVEAALLSSRRTG